MQDFIVLPKSNAELVAVMKSMFSPLKKTCLSLQDVHESGINYEKKFADAHWLVFGFVSGGVDASDEIKELLAKRSCLSNGKKLLNDKADLDSVITVFGEKARIFFEKLNDKKHPIKLSEYEWYEWEKGIDSVASWYKRLCQTLDVL